MATQEESGDYLVPAMRDFLEQEWSEIRGRVSPIDYMRSFLRWLTQASTELRAKAKPLAPAPAKPTAFRRRSANPSGANRKKLPRRARGKAAA